MVRWGWSRTSLRDTELQRDPPNRESQERTKSMEGRSSKKPLNSIGWYNIKKRQELKNNNICGESQPP